jgi:hypothetical protein
VIASGGEFRLYPRGTSMMPLLREGRDSVALVAPDRIKRGDILLYRREDGQFVLHRLLRIEKDKTLTFCGDNQSRLEKGISPDAVIARVAYFWRDDKRVSPKSLRYFTYRTATVLPPLRALRVWRKLY